MLPAGAHLPFARQSVMDFLAEREKMLRGYGLNPDAVELLVPQTEDGAFYTERHYARTRREPAWKKAEQAWEGGFKRSVP